MSNDQKPEVKKTLLAYVVAPLAPRIKHNGGDYWPGDVIEAPKGELDHLVKKGYVIDPVQLEKKGEYQATDEAIKKQGKRIRNGRSVETPRGEGKLDDDGDSLEVGKPKKNQK